MASVGVLAAIVNIVVLLTVAVVDRIIELVVRNFAASRLRRERRAPVVHDSDTWLPNIPRSVVKYRRHPAILVTVMCALFLIASEIITELGVDVSDTCSPVKKTGNVITHGDSSNSFTEVELGTSAFFLQSTTFLDGALTRVPSGLPRSVSGKECIVCMGPDEYPDIMNGCSIRDGITYAPGKLLVSILTTSGPFKTITDKMTEVGSNTISEEGRGDLTFNGIHWSAFYFYRAENDDLVYLEYSDQEHLPKLVSSARENANNPAPGAIVSTVVAKRIKCTTNLLSPEKFRNALAIYRTIQLENTIKPATFVPEQNSFKNLTIDDVYRAGLSVKVIDDELTSGDYFEYTSCGKYKWVFLLPIVVCTVCVFLLFTVSMVLRSGFDASRVPHNSRSWFRLTQSMRREGSRSEGPVARARSSYIGSMFDEMVLLEDGSGSSTRIGLRSRDGKVAPLSTERPIIDFANDPSADGRPANVLNAPGNVVITTEVEVPAEPDTGVAPEALAPTEHVSSRF